MGIKDLVNKVKARVTGDDEFGLDEFNDDEFSSDKEFGPGKGASSDEMDVEHTETASGAPPAMPKSAPMDAHSAPSQTPAPQHTPTSQPAAQDTSEIRGTLQAIKGKLEVLEAHLETIESKGEMQRTEEERFMQYLSFLNEKLDHLEQEHSEIERLLREKKSI